MQNTKLTKLKRPALILGEVIMLVGITLFAVFPFSCKVSTSGIEVIGSDYTVPALDGFSVESSTTLVLSFSDDVKLLTAAVSEFEDGITDSITHSTIEELSPALKSASAAGKEIPVTISYGADKKTVTVNLLESTKVGQKYIFYGEVENKSGSSLTFTVSFTGYNSKIPHLLLTEIHDGKVSAKSANKGLCEYVEFLALNDGNLSGLVVKSVYDGDEKIFMMPGIDVKKGDYITVHYRKTDGQEAGCISEITGDKTLSTSLGSSDFAWDFWADNDSARLGASQDIILLENSNTGEIYQALFYSKNGCKQWGSEELNVAALKAVKLGLWKPSAEYTDAFQITLSSLVGIKRLNIDEIITAYNKGELTYPFASDKTEWYHISNGSLKPGKPDGL